MQSPQHSLFLLATLLVSQTIIDRKRVIAIKYSMITQAPQNMQKDFNAITDEVVPMKKAIPSVREVIVIEGPACLIARLILSSALK